MNRIFTFGCSFTNYAWLTWADIILYNNEGYNLGRPGAGYDYILYRLLEADRKFNFTKDDEIIILLTEPLRLDVILEENNIIEWQTHGLALTSKFAEFNNKVFCVDGILYKSYNNILLMNNYLKSRNLKFNIFSITNLFENPNIYYKYNNFSKNLLELMSYVKNNVDIKYPSYSLFFKDKEYGWNRTKYLIDSGGYWDAHPRPKDHFYWVKNVLLKYVDIKININEELILEIEKIINNNNSQNTIYESLKKYLTSFFRIE